MDDDDDNDVDDDGDEDDYNRYNDFYKTWPNGKGLDKEVLHVGQSLTLETRAMVEWSP